MKFFSIIFFFLFFMVDSYALKMDSRRKEIIDVIDEEIKEVERLFKHGGKSGPEHLLRMAELYLEKAKLIKEAENAEYLELSDTERRKVNKNSFFKYSNKYFKAADDICRKINRGYRNFKSMPDVYYILAYNAKEFNQEKTAEKYFRLASEKAPRNSLTKVKSQISSAEIHYNNKRYKQAIALYEASLKSYQDKWWTKDAFNLAWSYFRIKQYSKAINLMQEIYQQSAGDKFVNMQNAVVRDIGFFYAVSGRIEDGISFYKKFDIDFSKRLLAIAVALKDEGKYAHTEKVLNYAERYNTEKDVLAEVYIEQLTLYAKIGKNSLHYKSALKLNEIVKQGNGGKEAKKKIIYEASKEAALMQKKAASKTYNRLPRKRMYFGDYAIKYFDIVEQQVPEKVYEFRFLKAETYFVVPKFTLAMETYQSAFLLAKAAGNKTYQDRSMEGMLAVLGQRGLSNKAKEQYYVPVYNQYLDFRPDGQTSDSIYQKLFKIYIDRGQVKEAEALLLRHKKYYPNANGTHEAMIANIMEYHHKKNNEDEIRSWVERIDNREFIVSSKYRAKLKELLTAMQMNAAQLSLKSGEKKKALVEYHELIERKDLTRRARANALYNLGILYYELGKTDQSFKYASSSLGHLTASEASKFSDTYLQLGNFLFEKRELMSSALLSLTYLGKVCRLKTQSKLRAYKNAYVLFKAEGRPDLALKLIDDAKKCNISDSLLIKNKVDLLDSLFEQKKYDDVEKVLSEIKNNSDYYSELILYSHKLSIAYLGSTSKQNYYTNVRDSFMAKAKNKGLKLEALDIIAEFENEKLAMEIAKLKSIRLSFPDTVFNNLLKNKLVMLDRVSTLAVNIQKLGSGRGILEAYKQLIDVYDYVVNEIKGFSPPGKSSEYVVSFQNAMQDVWRPLDATKERYKVDLKKVVYDNDILSPLFVKVVPVHATSVPSEYVKGIVMDRRGR